MPGPRLRRGPLALTAASMVKVEKHFGEGAITARGVDRVARLAWTLADLAGADRPDAGHVGEALGARDAA